MRIPAILLLGAMGLTVPTAAREVIDASPPSDLSVTIYRDSERDPDAPLVRDNPRGFALISETRKVTLPAGQTTIRFEGVAEGMIGVSAIVTGLPGGTIEKNRNAQLLSPAALVDGTLGNRVTITRTNPVTGAQVSQEAVVRTRADGGLVLQTGEGFEAVRCSGLPEALAFDRVPDGLSSSPVFSVDTISPRGGTYDVTLTYLAWGFDWQADYVATLKETTRKRDEDFDLRLLSWLTLVNENGQSFNNARLQIIAGKLNVESNYEGLADPPVAEPLRLECYPIGSTSAGIALPAPPPPPPPPGVMEMQDRTIVVTGSRLQAPAMMATPVKVMTADEEDLGDLKLFRVPVRVDVAAKGMKQVAFLNKDDVRARYLYQITCDAGTWIDPDSGVDEPAELLLTSRNEPAKGLGVALPQGKLTLYEPSPTGLHVAAQANLRDYARGQDMELSLGTSAQVFARCGASKPGGVSEARGQWNGMQARLTNGNPHPVRMRLQLAWGGGYDIKFPQQQIAQKNGYQTVVVTIPANTSRTYHWKLRDRTNSALR
ncbi:DUF4139 domain-containing protein [Erythrobacter sp. R86502]|uniref:DUF4139 domain-containing protein n=1 Tax=Erythrobacter sp. R86502 TaxID=3093846 RepID=UPI0036D269C3